MDGTSHTGGDDADEFIGVDPVKFRGIIEGLGALGEHGFYVAPLSFTTTAGTAAMIVPGFGTRRTAVIGDESRLTDYLPLQDDVESSPTYDFISVPGFDPATMLVTGYDLPLAVPTIPGAPIGRSVGPQLVNRSPAVAYLSAQTPPDPNLITPARDPNKQAGAAVPDAGKGESASSASDADILRELALARRAIPEDLPAWLQEPTDGLTMWREIALKEQASLNAAIAWRGARVAQLFDALADDQRKTLAAELLRAGAGLLDPRLVEEQVNIEKERVLYFKQITAYSAEVVVQRQKWRWLASWVPGLLIVSVVIAALLTWLVLEMVGQGHLDGWQAALLIFVLAITAISPTSLLLLERPLKGLDEFKPPGPPGTGGSGDSDATANSTDAGSGK